MGCVHDSSSGPGQAAPALDPRRQIQPKAGPPKSNSGQIQLDIPIRFQWENAGGYCGETSVQACSIYYGNYISQN